MTAPQPKRYIYVADRAARAYDSPYVGKSCVRAGPWIRGKAIMRFDDGREVVCLVGNGRMRIADDRPSARALRAPKGSPSQTRLADW